MKSSKRKNNLKIISIFIIILLVVLTTIFLYPKDSLVQTKEVPYEFGVTDAVGFKLETDKLYFGTTYPGGGAYRGINLETENDFYVKIRYIGEGTIIASENNFFLAKNQNKSIEFQLQTGNLTEGNYSGIIYVEFHNPKYYKNK